MSGALSFLRDFVEGRLCDLHTAMPCKVVRFDESAATADVQPMCKRRFRGKAAQDLPVLSGLPVLKRKIRIGETLQVETPEYEAGDIVLVVFCERALDRVLVASGPVDPGYSRKHALEDGVIIGLLR